MSDSKAIVAYLYKGEWIPAEQVERKRVGDKGAYQDAHPYTIAALRNRLEYGPTCQRGSTWISKNNDRFLEFLETIKKDRDYVYVRFYEIIAEVQKATYR